MSTLTTSSRKRVHFERDDSRLNTAVAIALLALLTATCVFLVMANSNVAAINASTLE